MLVLFSRTLLKISYLRAFHIGDGYHTKHLAINTTINNLDNLQARCQEQLQVRNNLSGKKERLVPQQKGRIGMYVCGPTVYSKVHLGNMRTFIFFDVVYKYLKVIGYKVRYVRNITDVGHLHAGQDTDKIHEEAKKKEILPMQVANTYTHYFREMTRLYNLSVPDVEPVATAHLIEQISYTQSLIDRGYAYLSNDSVYFDVIKYNKHHSYGILSNRKIEDLRVKTRPELQGGEDKRHPYDFALWKLAPKDHLMRWPSPWGEGFPGWHLECSVMSSLYLGKTFDIHGGGIDLKFPHHDCEIAQSVAAHNSIPATYWMHVNMLTHQEEKMSKSKGNAYNAELHTLNNEAQAARLTWLSAYALLKKDSHNYPAMRFYFLQTHYTATLDFSEKAFSSSTKGYHKLLQSFRILQRWAIQKEEDPQDTSSVSETDKRARMLCWACYEAMNDDFNTPGVLAALFELSKIINTLRQAQKEKLSANTQYWLYETFRVFFEEVLDIVPRGMYNHHAYTPQVTHGLLKVLLTQYRAWKVQKTYDRVDEIRAALAAMGISIQDEKDGTPNWRFKD